MHALAAPATPHAFYGTWTVTDVVGYSDISDGIPAARRLLGQKITITRREITFDGDTCRPHAGFTVTSVDTASKLQSTYQVNRTDTGLPPRTLFLDSAEGCGGIFRMDAHRILFGRFGVVVRAVSSQPSP